jgi:malate dehydrogenase (oxaloacetate-decarboxylating)(NADP+)
VGVITNGTAVLGLGNIGPLAAKPVMEGKGCLFKKFAGIDVFDIELAENDPDKLVDIIAALEPTLGGINLEDIKAPECFYIEKKLRERMNIPVFHDDQHGTAIISAAALLNGLELVGKKIEDVKIAVSGAGAAAIACLDVMVGLGAKPANIYACDSKGLIYVGRAGGFDESKARYAQKDTGARTLADVVKDADVFLGCSAPGVMTAEMVKTMGTQPIILALANPEPEIRPELAKAVRPDCIIATGRSDYPNQVNNVLCFPYIFRGALDCGATKITEEMKLACVREIADLTKADISEEVATAYAGKSWLVRPRLHHSQALRFAPDPAHRAGRGQGGRRFRRGHPADRGHGGLPPAPDALRLPDRHVHAPGVHRRQAGHRQARGLCRRRRRARAARRATGRGRRPGQPILVGRPAVIEARIKKAGLHIRAGTDFEIVNPEDDPRFRQYWETFHKLMGRRGVTPEAAKTMVRRSNTTIAALMLHLGDADAMICGLVGRFDVHLEHIRNLIGLKRGAPGFATLNALTLEKRTVFITDTNVNEDPSAELLAQHRADGRRGSAPLRPAAQGGLSVALELRHLEPRLGTQDAAGARPVRADGARHRVRRRDARRRRAVGRSAPHRPARATLTGEANLLVCPNLDSAHILYNVLKMTGANGITVGPILLGAAGSAHVLTPTSTVRRIVNMTALAVANATTALK